VGRYVRPAVAGAVILAAAALLPWKVFLAAAAVGAAVCLGTWFGKKG
jgi:hypothetical protein